jgi:hypothetical protein
MCLGILALDRNYSDIRPRRPEGGRDGARDIECNRLGEKCFGAVSFQNNASDSPSDKKEIQKKFKDDVIAARKADTSVKVFVFFCNVDFTPGEIKKFEDFARKRHFTYIDIYWRERIRMALDNAEGLAIRFQYLNVNLSDEEQKAFFARYGKELEDLLHGRFDRIEQKLDELEFARWKAGHIHSLNLNVRFKKYIESKQQQPEHFRVALELQGLMFEKRSIILGCRDEFMADENHFSFGTKKFFWREQFDNIKDSWLNLPVKVHYDSSVTGIYLPVIWRPVSTILAVEFEGLRPNIHFTANLADRIDHIRFTIDDYIFLDWEFTADELEPYGPSLGWPEELTEDELRMEWLCQRGRERISLDRTPQKLRYY